MTTPTSASQNGIRYAALSDVGRKRPINQDAHTESLAPENEKHSRGHFFVVADGMGAHAAGELASQLAVQEVETHYRSASHGTAEEALALAMQKANAVIHERGQRDTQLYNMGTTCSTLVIVPEGAIAAHVGDSRVYRCRNHTIQQLTFDHSLVWEMRAAGQLGQRDSMIPRNVITRCLGPHAEVEIDVEGPFSVQKGDVFLLCSDGLTGRVSDSEVGTIASSVPLDVAVQFLVDLANLRGGSDNITVVIAEITEEALNAAGKVRETTSHSSTTGTHAGWSFLAGAGLLTVLIGLARGDTTIAAFGIALFSLSVMGAGFQWFRQSDHNEAQNVAPYAKAEARVSQAFVDSIMETFEAVLESLPPETASVWEAEIRTTRKLSGVDEKTHCQTLANLARRLIVETRDELDSPADDAVV